MFMMSFAVGEHSVAWQTAHMLLQLNTKPIDLMQLLAGPSGFSLSELWGSLTATVMELAS